MKRKLLLLFFLLSAWIICACSGKDNGIVLAQYGEGSKYGKLEDGYWYAVRNEDQVEVHNKREYWYDLWHIEDGKPVYMGRFYPRYL